MAATDVILELALCAYAVLIGWGITIRYDRDAARLCFWFGTLILEIAMVVWGVNSDTRFIVRSAVSFVFGGVLLVGLTESIRWVKATATAQMGIEEPKPVDMGKKMSSDDNANRVIGATIVGNNQGGSAVDIRSTGVPGQKPPVGASINATAQSGQSVTGLAVSQTGPGTGLSVTQSGPGVGLSVTATVGRPSSEK